MKKLLTIVLMSIGLTAAASAALLPRPLAGDVTVTVTYTGKGTVDDAHGILVFLFDHAVPTADSVPIGMQKTTKSGGTVTFKDVQATPVFVTVDYDEKSTYDGMTGPPPAGTPIGSYRKDGKVVAVTPGPDAKIKVSFDDSVRWK